jgi:hypothetical protein
MIRDMKRNNHLIFFLATVEHSRIETSFLMHVRDFCRKGETLAQCTVFQIDVADWHCMVRFLSIGQSFGIDPFLYASKNYGSRLLSVDEFA